MLQARAGPPLRRPSATREFHDIQEVVARARWKCFDSWERFRVLTSRNADSYRPGILTGAVFCGIVHQQCRGVSQIAGSGEHSGSHESGAEAIAKGELDLVFDDESRKGYADQRELGV